VLTFSFYSNIEIQSQYSTTKLRKIRIWRNA